MIERRHGVRFSLKAGQRSGSQATSAGSTL
jgi:hypothetical protein